MSSLPLCFIFFVSMLLYKSSKPVQGRDIDVEKPPGKFKEIMVDAG